MKTKNKEEIDAKKLIKAMIYTPIGLLLLGYHFWYEDYKEKVMR